MASFQVVLASDSKTFRTYTLFNYWNLTWNFSYKPSAQGYKTENQSLCVFNLPTSMSASAKNLTEMTGNTGMLKILCEFMFSFVYQWSSSVLLNNYEFIALCVPVSKSKFQVMEFELDVVLLEEVNLC